MKSKPLFIPLLLSLLSVSAVHLSPISTQELQAEAQVTVYLDLTRYGLFDGETGNNLEDVHLANVVVLSGQPGDPLPDETRITSSKGATFLNWVETSNQGLVKVTAFPSGEEIKIYQAWWEELPPPLVGEDPEDPPSENYAYLSVEGKPTETYRLTKTYSDILNCDEYVITNTALTLGDVFLIKTTNDLFNVGATLFPTYQGGSATTGYTLSASPAYRTSSYLELVNTPDEQGPDGEENGGTYHKFYSPHEPGGLRAKATGNYDIYITFWDSYSWVRIYMVPSL